MDSDKLIDLGKIVSAHGLTGELNYIPFNQASDLPLPDTTVIFRLPGGRTVTALVTAVRDKVKFRLLTVQGCTDRTSAERFRGAIVACPRSELPPLDPDEFYYSDVIGLPVQWPDGTQIGRVTQVLSLATTVIEIESPEGDEWMVPVVDGFVRSIGSDAVVLEPGALEME